MTLTGTNKRLQESKVPIPKGCKVQFNFDKLIHYQAKKNSTFTRNYKKDQGYANITESFPEINKVIRITGIHWLDHSTARIAACALVNPTGEYYVNLEYFNPWNTFGCAITPW